MNSPRRILLVEDNPDDRELTLRAFNKHHGNVDVVTREDGEVALEYLFGTPTQPAIKVLPDLVLLDMQLPKYNGLDVLKRIRAEERTRLLPVVMLSSSSEVRDLLMSYACGANSYVRKPVDFDEFSEVVRLLGQYWLVVNRCPDML